MKCREGSAMFGENLVSFLFSSNSELFLWSLLLPRAVPGKYNVKYAGNFLNFSKCWEWGLHNTVRGFITTNSSYHIFDTSQWDIYALCDSFVYRRYVDLLQVGKKKTTSWWSSISGTWNGESRIQFFLKCRDSRRLGWKLGGWMGRREGSVSPPEENHFSNRHGNWWR